MSKEIEASRTAEDREMEDAEMEDAFNDNEESQPQGEQIPDSQSQQQQQQEELPQSQNEKPNNAPKQDKPHVSSVPHIPDLPELTRKDKTLKEVLDLMDGEFAPIIPDSVTDYYLAKNGFEASDVKIKRLLALATQKFILDIAQDAYEYSRIRNASSVYNSSNPQVRAKQLLQGQQFANQQSITGASNGSGTIDGQGEQQPQQQHSSSNAGNQQGKIVLTMEDLSSALSEYGLNTSRPDFYR
ncbi:hypothetical protein QCA50_017702 [Cerrena zonata]|uniref:Transcription initiation factor TFIID subunit 10 n=1 Tax=Cerrena zonata TaxID=2478898 RepID=A0AAW0FGD8_9APHY